MAIERVAVIYSDVPRPETTGFYCLRALSQLVQAEHFRPSNVDHIPRTGFDLYLSIDDGLPYDLPTDLRPCAYWAIDTHVALDRCLKRAMPADFVFAAQQDGAARLVDAGISGTLWLPLGCDPEIHRKHDVPKRFNVCFVGNIYGPRADLLRVIRSHFSDVFVGQLYFDQMAEAYSASRVVFNRSIENDVNMRVFEALACGSLLLTNDLWDNGQADLFQDGVHLATYRDAEEMLDKIRFYLDREHLRERIAAAGRDAVLKEHTYRCRMQRLLNEVEASSGFRAVAAIGERPTRTQDPSYFEGARPELLKLIPATARRVLDIGCGAGRLGEALKARQPAEVVGVELSATAAERAKGRLDQVIVGDIETLDLAFDQPFGCIVCGDVLEHLERPDVVLAKLRDWLAPGGRLVSSIPNVRHHTVVRALMEGNWTYEPAGLLDETHLRFFTRRDIEQLFAAAGYRVLSIGCTAGQDYQEWQEQGSPGTVRIGKLTVAGLPRDEVEQFFAYQFLVTAERYDTSERGDDSSVHREAAKTRRAQTESGAGTPAKELLALIHEGAKRSLVISSESGLLHSFERERPSTEWQHLALPEVRDDQKQGSGPCDQILREMPSTATAAFACIVCDGVLERLHRPRSGLTRLRAILQPGGSLIAQVPNVHHHTVLAALLGGAWPWQPGGAPQHDQLRFYTRREIEKLLYRCGFAVETVQAVANPELTQWRKEGGPREVRVGPLHLGDLPAAEAEDIYTEKYLVRAVPEPAENWGLSSIVIVTFNQLNYTRQCLESIRFLTDEPYELIVVDNGSTDGTVEYLRSCSDVRLIENAENRGFPAAVNQGIEVSRGEQILLLNNDVVVTTGWLRHQLAALRSDQQVGLVGPCSNCVAGFQQVPVRYEDLACLDGFAWEWGKEHRGNIIEVDRLMGFCLLIRREVIERIGLFDERFGIGNFEDDDFCRRARQDGFRAGIAQAAFIHHFGHASFRGSGADLGAILKRNEQLYREKWGDAGHAEKPCGAESANAGLKPKFSVRIADDGLLLVPATIRLSLCMICRDNAGTIGACLESIRPWVDELIVVDTGSKDDSPEICRRLGAEVHDFAWPDCFSTARNESLKYARGEWIFWMDSDDTISPECGRKLRELAYGPHDHAVLGYVVQVHCPGGGPDGEADMTVVDHVKLFRNRPDLRFDGRIHEQIIPAIRRAGGEVGWTDLYVTHSGADHTPEGRKRKLERDMRLLELDLADRPDHPFVLFNLGMTFADAGHHEQAVSALKRSIEVADPSESQVRKAYALLLGSLCQLERLDEALECCQRGRDLFPKDPELLFREGILAHKVGDLARAERAYLAALNGGDERHFTSIDRGIVGFKARHNLAAVYMDRGESAAAEEQWRQAIGEMPSFREAWHCLADLLLRQRRHAELRDLIAQIEQYPSLRAIGTLVQAQFERAQGNIAGVRAMLSSALRQYPAEIELQRFRCQFLFEHGDPSEAEEALHELLQLDPTDASVHHNLGTTYLRTARFDAAVCSLRESLRLRPKSSPTLVNLGYGLDQLGRTDDAIAAWKQALDYDPEYLPAREALLSKGAS